MQSRRLLDEYPRAKRFKRLDGLYVLGRDHFLVEVKVSYLGATVGYQAVVHCTLKEAIQKWKDAKSECLARAKEKRRAQAVDRLRNSRIRLFK